MVALIGYIDPSGALSWRHLAKDDGFGVALARLAAAVTLASSTTRPAFREIADTIRWDELR